MVPRPPNPNLRWKNWPLLVAALGLATGAGACGEDRPPPFADVDGGNEDAGPDLPDALPPNIDAAPIDPEGPMVTILEPTAPAPGDFDAAAILTDDRFTVRCMVTDSLATPALVDSSSVRVSAVQGVETITVAAQPTGVTDEYAADLSIGAFVNGPVDIRCSANDTADPPLSNSVSITTFFDQGPQIDVFVPDINASYASQLDILFSVAPDPVDPGDTAGAEVDVATVAVTLSGHEIANVVQMGSTYTSTVAFNDPVFGDPLLGEQTLRIVAADQRGVVRQKDIVFNVDSEGPTITVEEPLAGELVSGIMRLRATVVDDVDVEPTSVVATVAGIHEVPMAPDVGGGEFVGFFDTRVLEDMVFPTIVVRARDLLANQSSFGMLVTLDNVPPLVDLDSPRIREGRYVTTPQGQALECSWLFDPVGEDAVNDGMSIAQLSEFRVRTEDRPNVALATNAVLIPRAGVEETTVDLFILDDADGALVVDSDGDGNCDDINPLLVPTSVPMAANEVARLDMQALDPTGSAIWGGFMEDPAGPPDADDDCNPAPQPEPAEPLCLPTPMTQIIPDPVGEPAIYTIPPINDALCVGNAFDSVATNISDGWACVAVRVEDRLGNVNVSAPLRVCVDHDLDGIEGCPPLGTITPPASLPDCSGTYDPMANTVDIAQDCAIPAEDEFVDHEVRVLTP